MQASSEESELTSSPSFSSDFRDEFGGVATEVCEDFWGKMKLNDFDGEGTENSAPRNEEVDDDDNDDDEDFSFASISADAFPISADDVFHDGHMKPIFPFFDQSILFAGDSVPSKDDLPYRPPVKKVFFESEDSSPLTRTEKETEGVEGEAAGPYCTWSGKAVEASPEVCKKSSSTGFSKFWRFRELLNRSNSDGRDAFVFLNNDSTTTNSKRDEKVDKSDSSLEKKTAIEAKANSAGGKVGAKKRGKSETASLSAHELHYVRHRALREEYRRRSYLPYRPELVGFFTNVNGGLSRNLHPF